MVDNLYLDMNGIIHTATHNNAESIIEVNEEEMFGRIFTYTERLFKMVKPKNMMFLAIDGVAPRAKMNQQRSRRFRSSKEAEQLAADIVARTGSLPDIEAFDSNCITPGTEFMSRLADSFKKWIEYKRDTDEFWIRTSAKIIFSGPDVPGEGEHKVMDYIRQSRNDNPKWGENMQHCMYGLDADLIMLSLVTHEPKFYLLREKMRRGRNAANTRPKDPTKYTRDDYELLDVSILRQMLRLMFKNEATKLPFTFQIIRIIDDFVFMCILVGNDFLPNIPHLDIADGAINLMVSVYKDLLPRMGGYLTDKDAIHLCRFEMFVHELSRREAAYFRYRGTEEQNPEFQDPSKYKDSYYMDKLGLRPTDVNQKRLLARHYLEGLYWVLKYYHKGVGEGSWSWYFPHLYAPLGSDLKDLAAKDMEVTFTLGKPWPALLQLLSVLPGSSAPFLPEPYAKLMDSENSTLSKFYPLDFEVDPNGKHRPWESIVKIPFIEEEELFAAVQEIDHMAELLPEERLRNHPGHICVYFPLKGRLKSKPSGRGGAKKQQYFGKPTANKTAHTKDATSPCQMRAQNSVPECVKISE